jgi:peptidyl-tRNA hydrolase
MYVVVRRDMPVGLQMAQACHAAFLFAQTYAHQTLDWHRHSQYLVIVSVPDEVELMRLGLEASRRKIRTSWWHEPDLDDDLTAIVFEPTLASARLCANLPLAGRGVSAEPLTQAS